MKSRSGLLATALAAGALASACVEVTRTEYGNVVLTCTANQPCDCDVTGNCLFDCPGGGCTMRCLGQQANCVFSCAGGGCDVVCAAGTTGNCVATCGGGGCALSCSNTGNCSLSGCPTGTCSKDCANVGNCLCSTACSAPP